MRKIATKQKRVPSGMIHWGNRLGNFATDSNQRPTVPNIAKPAYLSSFIEPWYGTKITRITGDVGTTIPTTGGTWPSICRIGYNNRQPWNCDETVMILDTSGLSNVLYLDGSTYAPLRVQTWGPSYCNECRWHPSLPRVGLYCGSNASGTACEFGQFNIDTLATSHVVTVPGYTGASLGNTGNWSNDGTMAAVFATRTSDGKVVVFALNMNGTKYADIDPVAKGMTSPASTSIDYVTISPNGDLIYVNGLYTGGDPRGDAAMIFDIAGNTIQSWLEYGLPSHGDASLDAKGNQVHVGVDKNSSPPPGGQVCMRDMRTGAITYLTRGGYFAGASGQCIKLPHWAIVEDGNWTAFHNYPPYDDDICAVALDGSGIVARFAQRRGWGKSYDNQGFVVPSPSGTRIAYAANFHTSDVSDTPVQTYVIDLRQNLQ
ncbi:MAG: hypothetical protein ACREDT_11870 [Methylocella sp.]